jgi:hypothetical protein
MVSLLFPVGAGVDVLVLDAAISETHSGDADVTEHPVERGANVSDHVRVKAETLKLEGLITDTPVGAAGTDGRSVSAYRTLLSIKDDGNPIAISTPFREYTQMVMQSLEVPRDAKTGSALRFSASFRRIVTAETKVSRVIPHAKKALGKKPTAPTPPAVEVKAQSGFLLLNGLINKTIGLDP